MSGEVKTRIGRTIRKDGRNERFHTTVPIRFVEELGWKKGDRLRLRRSINNNVMFLTQDSLKVGIEITLCCRGDRYFYITLPRALVAFSGYCQGSKITWVRNQAGSLTCSLAIMFS